MPLTGQSALADASYMVSAPAKALIHSSVSDQNWKNCQLLRRRMAGFSAAVDTSTSLAVTSEYKARPGALIIALIGNIDDMSTMLAVDSIRLMTF